MAQRAYPRVKVAIAQPGAPLVKPAASTLLPIRRVLYEGYGGVHYPGDMDQAGSTGRAEDAWFEQLTFSPNPDPSNPSASRPRPPSGALWSADWEAWLSAGFITLGGTGDVHPPMMLWPYLDTRGWESTEEWGDWVKVLAQHVDLNYWEPYGYLTQEDGTNDYWSDYGRSQLGQATLYFSQGEPLDVEGVESVNAYAGLLSRFDLPIDPVFCIDLWRSRLSEDVADVRKYPFGTYIKFGITVESYFMLEIPYAGPAQLWWWDQRFTGQQVIPLQPEGELQISVAELGQQREANEDVQPTRIWIIGLPGGVLISAGNSLKNGTYYKYPRTMQNANWVNTLGERPHIRKGQISLSHNAGQFEFSFYPIWMPTNATYLPPVEPLAYPWNMNPTLRKTWMHRYPVLEWDGDAEYYKIVADALVTPPPFKVEDQKWSRVPLGQYYFEYLVRLNSHAYNEVIPPQGRVSINQQNPYHDNILFQTHRSPIMYYHTFWQNSYFVDSSVEADYVEVKDFSQTEAEGKIGRSSKVGLDNQMGGWRGQLQDGFTRRVYVGGTWVLDDDTEEVTWGLQNGYIGSFDAAAHQDIDLDANIVEFLQTAGQIKCEGDSPVFDNQRVVDGMAWICQRLGLFYLIENLAAFGTDCGGIEKFNYGEPTKPLWLPEAGRSWVDILKTMALYAGSAGLFVRNGVLYKGCPYCCNALGAPTLRNGISGSPLHWWYHLHNGPASIGCLLVDMTRAGNVYGIDWYLTVGANDRSRVAALTGDVVVLTDADVMWHEISSMRGPQFRVAQSYYNHVVVKGPTFTNKDEPLGVAYADWYSIRGTIPFLGYGFPLGYKKTDEQTLPWANTQGIVNRIAKARYANHAFRPEYMAVDIPYAPAACRGKVFCIIGGAALGVDTHKYRITDVEHKTGDGKKPYMTTLTGRYIGVLADMSGIIPEE